MITLTNFNYLNVGVFLYSFPSGIDIHVVSVLSYPARYLGPAIAPTVTLSSTLTAQQRTLSATITARSVEL